jgi:hypothetical protein
VRGLSLSLLEVKIMSESESKQKYCQKCRARTNHILIDTGYVETYECLKCGREHNGRM